MKKSRFPDSQILLSLKQAERGIPLTQLCRDHGMRSAVLYKWLTKHGGMDASLMARMKELERENQQLKRMPADVRLKNEAVMVALATKC